MKDTVRQMLEHPIATVIVLGAIGTAIASIVSAARGVPCKPFVDAPLSK